MEGFDLQELDTDANIVGRRTSEPRDGFQAFLFAPSVDEVARAKRSAHVSTQPPTHRYAYLCGMNSKKPAPRTRAGRIWMQIGINQAASD